MVKMQIVGRGITDARTIEAMRKVPRHEFVFPKDAHLAYEDTPLSIGEGQTISQPYMVALMTEALKLKEDERTLEIGTGSGYQTAILAELSKEVYTIERIPRLAERAEYIFNKLNYRNIKIKIADGTLGWGEDILFDAIIVTAASPTPLEDLLNQLKESGRMIIPIGNKLGQTLTLITKNNNCLEKREICQCVFVPLVGQRGWKEDHA